MIKLLWFFGVFYGTGLLAKPMTLEFAFQQLRGIPEDYRVGGTICERVGELILKEKYDRRDYRIHMGLIYRNSKRVLGELDLVVTRKEDGEAVEVVEVKCWKNLGKAARKAESQLNRFLDHVDSGDAFKMYSGRQPGRRFFRSQFDEDPTPKKMAQKGALSAGFHYELPFTLKQIFQLRSRLMNCQRAGMCPQP